MTTAERTLPPGEIKRASSARKGRKSFWLKQLHTWHWVSSAISLIGLLLFAITGFTLNHAAEIEAEPVTVETEAQLPGELLSLIGETASGDESRPLSPEIAQWVEDTFDARIRSDVEWSETEVYIPLPRPGGDGWVVVDRETGAAFAEATDRGWISYLNDLHKGRNTGSAWRWFIDIFVLACVVFSLTGLLLLQLHAAKRKLTWPLVGAGLVIPVAVAVVFIH